MTALRDAIDYTTLGWVKPELDETLRQTQMEIEGFAEDPAELSRMRYAAGLLHQVQGTLRMVELYAPAMVAEEMEALAKAIATGGVADRDEACATLMRGVVLLPDYLERLQSGHKDIPIVLLPLLNELRAVRGEKGLNESVLFSPDLDRPLPASVPEPTAGAGTQDDNTVAPLLTSLRAALADWSDTQTADYAQLMQALEGLLGQTKDVEARRMLWVAAETATALRDGALANSASLRDAFGSVEREARHLFENGAVAATMSPSQLEPTRQLLFHVAGGDMAHPSLEKLRVTFDLSSGSPTESELEHARGSVSGRNRALLDTVSAAIKEDLLRIKDALDLHLRTNREDANELQPQVEALDRVADTLGMLGLGVARKVVLQQRDALREIVFGGRSADEESLLDVAGALLYVDASLDDQVARLGQPQTNAEDDMVASESRKVLEVLVREAIANFADARQGFVAFVETNWDHAQLTEVPRLLDEVAGALRMLDMQLPAQYLTGVRRYTESELIARKRVPNGQQLDTLADSLASLEYYLEAVRDKRPNSEEILAITRQSLELLRYWPLPAEAATLPAHDTVVDTALEDAEHAEGTEHARALKPVPATSTPSAPAPAPVSVPETAQTPIHQAASAAGTAGSFDRSNDEIDDEIREVFLEEFEEEIANLGGLLPKWREQPEDMERLRPIRRVFHTLKGSGRLVGAKTLGEFSWKVESMLNRVLDGSRPPSPAVFAMIDQALLTLPQLHAALRGDASLDVDLTGLGVITDRVAAGEEVRYQPRAVEVAETGVPETVADTESKEVAAPETIPEPAALAPEMVRVSVDGVLLEILAAEVDGHLATVDGWLAQANAGPVRVDDAMLRAIHTMNGAFAMSEVPAITDATTPAEAYVKRLLGAKHVPAPEGIAALVELAYQIRATVAGLLLPISAVPRQTALAQRFVALRDSLPEATIFGAGLADEDTAVAEMLEAARLDAERLDAEHLEAERIEAERIETERLEAEHLEAERVAAEQADAERLEAERVAAEQAEAERLEAERVAAEQADAERLEAERVAVEQAEAERLEAERVAAEQADAERLEAERVAVEQAEAERLEAERVAAEQTEAERIAEAERLEYQQLEAEYEAERLAKLDAERTDAERARAARAHAERAEAERVEAERVEAERAEAERAEAERVEAERVEAERVEAERIEAERAEAERVEAERAEAERAEAERVEAERVEAERIEAERAEAERAEAERAEAERVEAERAEAERAEAERIEAEREEAERLKVERLENERLATERAEIERLDAERLEIERLEAELVQLAETERLESERVEKERLDAARLEAQRAEAARAERKHGKKGKKDKKRADGHEEAPESSDTEPAVAAMLATALASNQDPDEALDLTDLDPELVDIFVEEGSDILDHSDALLSQLRAAPNEREPVMGLQRDLHTLKGGARMAGIMAVGELGHAMESLLEAVAEQRSELGRDDIPLLERGFDRLHAMITRVGSRRAIAMPVVLIEQFDARAHGRAITAYDDATQPETAHGSPAPKIDLKPLSAPVDTRMGDDDDIEIRAPQEQVRIRADLLDRLVNYAGEVAIYRARLEQQLGAFRGAMSEMEQTNARLRDQLRRLDSETEAQIVARYQREHETADPRFDPLELDRFSTLQQLSRGLSESAADMASLQGSLEDLTRQYETLLLQQSRVSSDLQQGLMRTRMVPFDALVPRLRRVLRQAATDTGKQVQLRLDGAQGELDRTVLERMTAPLEHMLRNAVAHGLESPADRRKAGKPEEGSVRIAMRREGSEVVLEVSDDGGGLNRPAIRRRAEERGLVRVDAIVADADLDALILESGFSTADEVSRLAGRGVGMDVVHSEVRQLGGALDIASKLGQGVTFTLRLPQTLAVTQAVFVRIGETSFAVPIASVRGVGRINREELDKPDASYRYGGEDYVLHDLGTLVGHATAKAEGQLQMPLLLIRAGDLRAAVSVDQVIGNREIVVKPVGPQIASVPGIFGATIMGDGSVVVILDIAPLVRRQISAPREPTHATVTESRGVPLVMVVDDSVTMRKVTGRVLERHNFEVTTARDGIDALERMADVVPDLMLLDIEMPRMDGYELATLMKQDPRLRDVPIIMITSRTGEKHRQRALDIGVQRYLGKPYQEPELMRNVFELLGLKRDL